MSERRKVLFSDAGSERPQTYFTSGQRNPCGCGSNCYHYEFDGENIYGVCNACGRDIYQKCRKAPAF